ncbi:GGDEF domain-containing protein [Psychromonas sp. RZ22]|uniref:GGDEF domain-containing protein n=1 Tax=Psychromonas algarum TaxID=2555643 RepID=UPI001067F428|nr:GGDEF domain-containing protein [Psychromonas sp. RZ22]TEW55537.1 GGDEF domain-containing protein [Psychromonas sp. RZ22]
MNFFFRVFLASLLLSFTQSVWAIELINAALPSQLQESYKMRQLEPLSCIKTVTKFLIHIENIDTPKKTILNSDKLPAKLKKRPNNASTQLLASCYNGVEDYKKSLALLMPLLKNPSVTSDEIRTLNLIATEIPESERPQLSNETLLSMLTSSLAEVEKKENTSSPDLETILNFSIAKLALETHQYQLANEALTKARKKLKNTENTELVAWLAYFYGHYYDQINQHQLAVSHFHTANSIADKLHLIKLSSLAKESLSTLYQEKHRYTRAIYFASQRVELLLTTENYVQQAESLLKFAILKRQNKEFNQSLIYLFTALDLVEKKHKTLLADTYLELGRTYAAIPYDIEKNSRFAQRYLQNARQHFKILNKLEQQTESTLLLAELNIHNKDTGLAILQLEDVLLLAGDQFPDLRVKAFEMLALSYELSGDHQQANLYFKNFHALQNKIKERLFTLQQLKINEQFQLIEQTQQQIQLETQNNQLLLKNNRFKNIAYGIIALFLISLVVIFLVLIRNKKLIEHETVLRKKMQLHPRTKLQLYQAQLQNNELDYQGTPLFYSLVHVPFLNNLNELKGLTRAEEIEFELGIAIEKFFNQKTQVAQIRDNQLLFISEQTLHGDAEKLSLHIIEFFKSFAETHSLDAQVSSGVVAFPFLNNVSRAIAPDRMHILTSLALFGACQLREKVDESSWLELYAIERIQPAFFDGDLWLLGQAGIDKGIVKLKSSHPDTHIEWPELTR